MSSSFSPELNKKIRTLKARRQTVRLGEIDFASPLLLAPMSSICHWPFRLLMEELGAGGTVSELVSCHGINHGNEKTRKMLKIHPQEINVGIQLFGESAEDMARAAQVAESFSPKFIDINMGCPVRKVVTKGAGSALLRDTTKLAHFFKTIKDAINLPLTIKIRTGWDESSLNAEEVIHIAKEEGVEFVAIHGRTRTQAYRGHANWDYLESLSKTSKLPLIGNGDLHSAELVKRRLETSTLDAFMLARGPLRNPFIFLESYLRSDDEIIFRPRDYLEVIHLYDEYLKAYHDRASVINIQLKKHIVWFTSGFSRASKFRAEVFRSKTREEILSITQTYFEELEERPELWKKLINFEETFLGGGHGQSLKHKLKVFIKIYFRTIFIE